MAIKVDQHEHELLCQCQRQTAEDVAAELIEMAYRIDDDEYAVRLAELADVLSDPIAYASGDTSVTNEFTEPLDPTIDDGQTRWQRAVKAAVQSRRKQSGT